MSVAPVKLREDLELINGMDNAPLIFDPVTGVYHRVSPSAQIVLGYLDGTRSTDDLVGILSRGDAGRSEIFRQKLDAFLSNLDSSGLLVSSTPPSAVERQRRVRTSMLMPRIVVSRSLPTLLEPLAQALRSLPLPLLSGVALAGALLGFGLGAHTFFASARPDLSTLGPAFLTATALQLLLMLAHETAHALVAQIQRVPVRGLGFAMLFYFMPVAYVDRTDAYRLKGRWGRVAIALAGMTSDGWFCGLTALVALNSSGFVQQALTMLLAIQMIGLFINLNPLLPSDGYTALEAATGLVDARGRSFALLRSTALGRPLPSFLTNLTLRARWAHLTYGVVSLAYICCAGVFVAMGLIHSVEVAMQRVGR